MIEVPKDRSHRVDQLKNIIRPLTTLLYGDNGQKPPSLSLSDPNLRLDLAINRHRNIATAKFWYQKIGFGL